jgi:hypothetical protein
VGDMFLNFILHEDVRKVTGVDFTLYFPDELTEGKGYCGSAGQGVERASGHLHITQSRLSCLQRSKSEVTPRTWGMFCTGMQSGYTYLGVRDMNPLNLGCQR